MAAESKYNENSRMGFLRFFQFYCIVTIFLFLLAMIFVTGYTITFNPIIIISLYSFLINAVAVYVVGRRLKVARKMIIIMYAVEIVVTAAIYWSMGYTLGYCLGTGVIGLLWIIYFATSRRAKAVLVQPFVDEKLGAMQKARSREMFDFKSKDFWLRMLVYFFMFCVIGHWMEAGFCTLVNMGVMPGNITPADSVQFRDSLNPFPIYGIGFVAVVLLLHPLKVKCLKKFKGNFVLSIIVTYLVALVIVAAAELILGYTCNQNYTVWDYRNQPFNYDGQICLSYTCMFGFVAMVVVWIIFPVLEFLFSYLSRDTFRIVFVVALALFILLFVSYSLNADDMFKIQNLSVDMSQQDLGPKGDEMREGFQAAAS